ncbi:MAG: NAD(P)-binding domain-containing protein [Lunatimonas sp.]|uniref:NADPH-dependent F420 reductase n=1 Tax=Lunatimonas sp. TaxID=2060141 RepID=UPI00263BBCC3|nr:NAD(P)-binding domain-containing protein [Lunatimonas sp.]MCC5938879.1 NAD(P)-binding domain-containing protein [Lunatimonas sp.]
MKIAIIGTGNVGGALATAWAQKGHEINLGVRDMERFKGTELLANPRTSVSPIADAVSKSDVILMATPATNAVEITQSLGDTTGKVILDAGNIILGRGPQGFNTVSEAILAHTNTRDVVKCFNTTGYNNMANPLYGELTLDMFMAGDSLEGKLVARQLAKDAGFAECYDIGGNDRFGLLEQLAWFWINLAMVQGHGRDIGIKILKR